ncbi:hypothetical protein DVH24_023868 [Malus domestica]|uniref:Uncharacterized protein n=1 Tax=Malus domestica TaxID=3750 RepID=A0A498JJS9_MALDO|nr:hypothetical protein DVH24_023868 [Malus domestica]
MVVIYNLLKDHTVKEISFADWNSPPIDEHVDNDEVNHPSVNEVDEDGREINKIFEPRVEHQVKIVYVKETLEFMNEVSLLKATEGFSSANLTGETTIAMKEFCPV